MLRDRKALLHLFSFFLVLFCFLLLFRRILIFLSLCYLFSSPQISIDFFFYPKKKVPLGFQLRIISCRRTRLLLSYSCFSFFINEYLWNKYRQKNKLHESRIIFESILENTFNAQGSTSHCLINTKLMTYTSRWSCRKDRSAQ